MPASSAVVLAPGLSPGNDNETTMPVKYYFFCRTLFSPVVHIMSSYCILLFSCRSYACSVYRYTVFSSFFCLFIYQCVPMLAGQLSNLHSSCYSGIIYYVPRFTVHLLSLCIAFLFFCHYHQYCVAGV